MPMLPAATAEDDVAGTDFFLRPTAALCPATAGGDDLVLAQRMSMPSGPCVRLKCDHGSGGTSRLCWFKEWVDSDVSGEIVFGSLYRGS